VIKVVHLTSVHHQFDTRIFHKECKTLARAGYDVTLVVPSEKDEMIKGVKIKAIKHCKSRWERMTISVWKLCQIAFELDAEIYHFHDPELIPLGIFLKIRRKKVIYDIHEDYQTSIQQKKYILNFFRLPLSYIFAILEKLCSHFFEIILAEKYYVKRFAKGHIITNYPLSSKNIISTLDEKKLVDKDRINLIYTGCLTEDRGALLHIEILKLLDNVQLYTIGRCEQNLAERMKTLLGSDRFRLHLVGEGYHVPYSTILEFYQKNIWTAGLAIFPATPHYMEKELTKFFEYMAAGIPIICSNFPVWKSLIEENGVGICVDPENKQEIVSAIQWLVKYPEKAKEMGKRGQAAVRDRYNWDCEAKKLLSFYQELQQRK
jgi:glycosyltransferase involved in cell wall biosynthesis